jgi:hypothetical protein
MSKEIEHPKEPAREKAARRWRNHDLVKRYKEGRLPFVAVVDPDDIDYENQKIHVKESPKIASVIETDKPKADNLTRLQNRFKKEIRDMLVDHTQRNLALYAASLQHQKRVLLLEKLRRLEAGIAQAEGKSNG